MNIKNYIFRMKPLVGSNDSYSKDICSTAGVNDDTRALYTIQYNEGERILDVEIVQSIILQYCFYCCLRDENNDYDSFPIELPEMLKKDHSMIISVLFSLLAINCRFPHTTQSPMSVALKLR